MPPAYLIRFLVHTARKISNSMKNKNENKNIDRRGHED